MNGTELSGSAAENAAELNNAEPVDRATIAPVTDVHAHVMITGLEDSVRRRAPQEFALAGELDLRRNGAESAAVSGEMIGSRIAKLTRLDTRIADMDAQGVDVQWVSPSPSHYYPWADEDLATWTVREANLRVAELVASAPSRLLGLGLVPLQHPERIVECVDDAVLGRGLIGVEIPSFAGDVELSDDRLEPFWARMEALGAIVFLHPFGCSLDERLDRFYLSNTVGQPVETATALSHLIFAGVLDRHPKLKVVAAHGGGYLPTTIGRSDHAWNVREDAQGCAEPPSSYLRRIWYDTVVHDARQLRHLIEVVEADRVVLGSDYPFDMGLDDPVHEVAGMLSTEGFDNEITDALLRSNAAAMLSPTTVSAQERTRQ